jgi:hypothetical protein
VQHFDFKKRRKRIRLPLKGRYVGEIIIVDHHLLTCKVYLPSENEILTEWALDEAYYVP